MKHDEKQIEAKRHNYRDAYATNAELEHLCEHEIEDQMQQQGAWDCILYDSRLACGVQILSVAVKLHVQGSRYEKEQTEDLRIVGDLRIYPDEN